MRFILAIIINLFPLVLYGQSVDLRNNINFGIGYFGDVTQFLEREPPETPEFIKNNPKVVGKIFNGYSMRIGYERLLNTGFVISSNVYKADVNVYCNDPLGLYWDEQSSDKYFVSEFLISKNLLINDKLCLMPFVGLLFRQIHFNVTSYEVEVVGEDLFISSIPDIKTIVMNDLGLGFGIDLRRSFNNNFYIGLSLRTNLIFDIGFETVSIAPICGVRF